MHFPAFISIIPFAYYKPVPHNRVLVQLCVMTFLYADCCYDPTCPIINSNAVLVTVDQALDK